MAKYTIELGRLIKSGFDIGLGDYPIFNENHRTELNNKIIQHYYHSEIGLETPALFKRYLNNKMCEIMPYYNKMCESEALEFNPLDTYDKTTTENRIQNTGAQSQVYANFQNYDSGSNNSSNSNITNAKNVYSDTPQGMLSETDVEGETYATNANIGNSTERGNATGSYNTNTHGNNNSTTTNTGNLSQTIAKSEHGKDGTQSYSKLLEEYRQTILNIDMMIIDELSQLFMGIW